MNFRDRINPQRHEDEPAYIKFNLDWEWANLEAYCSKDELATFLVNIIDVCKRIIEDNDIPDDRAKIIYKHRKSDIKNLPLNQKKC